MIWFWWHQTTCNSNKIVRARLHCRHFCVFSVGLSVFFWVLGFIQWLYPLHDSCRTEKQKGISSLLQHLKLFTGLAVELPAVKGWTPASSRKTRGRGFATDRLEKGGSWGCCRLARCSDTFPSLMFLKTAMAWPWVIPCSTWPLIERISSPENMNRIFPTLPMQKLMILFWQKAPITEGWFW